MHFKKAQNTSTAGGRKDSHDGGYSAEHPVAHRNNLDNIGLEVGETTVAVLPKEKQGWKRGITTCHLNAHKVEGERTQGTTTRGPQHQYHEYRSGVNIPQRLSEKQV